MPPGNIASQSELPNPFRLDVHRSREKMIAAYLRVPGSFARLETAVRGKVLECWCHPRARHGDEPCKLVE
jgi:hypothetical protein